MALMEGESGKHFDPYMLKVFLSLAPKLYKRIGNTAYEQLTHALADAVRKYFIKSHLQ
ncbi:hypothetical protein ACFL2V_14250 [Pseudomonadota bacterium]